MVPSDEGGFSVADLQTEVIDGLRRLAFGCAEDAVTVCLSGGAVEDIAALNLFNIAEMKRGRETVEIKFFDRFKALDRLYEIAQNGERDEALSFFEALQGEEGEE